MAVVVIVLKSLYNCLMSMPILATKLYIPQTRPKIVFRPRLIERLNEGLHRKMTLIAAPAGFGKTTLISEWTISCEQNFAWLSLDEGDNDLIHFLSYLIAALQTIAVRQPSMANVGEGVLNALRSPQSPPIELLLITLINEITAIPDHFILVLDDYHMVSANSVSNALTFILEHLPPQIHVVVASREDPALPLSRLRAKNQLTELRAADLRFTSAESARFLNQVMGLALSEEDITTLETRTEGWIAGLQLAALSMQGRSDIHDFIQSFTGSHRFILDYLVEEVLHRQPEQVYNFLLRTSILDRLSDSLCDAIIGQENCSGMLDILDRNNLFIVPLDDTRHWYRYHHLFADVLQSRLIEEQPDRVSGLHQKASTWYEQNSFSSDAIRHALVAGNLENAARLIELVWFAMDINMQSATWLGWVKALPEEMIRSRPVLSVGYAWALLDSGEMETCETWLKNAEEKLMTT
jgi:LuxR family maltose regulon positive regulatory protein